MSGSNSCVLTFIQVSQKVGKVIWYSHLSKNFPQFAVIHSASLIAQLVKNQSNCHAGDPSSISGSGRSPGEGIDYTLQYSWASLVAQLVKNPPAMLETWVQSLGWEDPLEEAIASLWVVPVH